MSPEEMAASNAFVSGRSPGLVSRYCENTQGVETETGGFTSTSQCPAKEGRGVRISPELVHAPQYGGGIRAATSETRGGRDAFGEGEVHPTV